MHCSNIKRACMHCKQSHIQPCERIICACMYVRGREFEIAPPARRCPGPEPRPRTTYRPTNACIHLLAVVVQGGLATEEDAELISSPTADDITIYHYYGMCMSLLAINNYARMSESSIFYYILVVALRLTAESCPIYESYY